jgi:hypothetical protein
MGIGENIMLGILNGILDSLGNIGTWIKDNIFAPFIKEFNTESDKNELTFGIGVKNDSSTWWSDVKKWWDGKVGAAKSFTTSAKNDSATWWSNVKKWWSGKAGAAKSFTTSVKDDSATWWSNVKKWWSDRTGSAGSVGTFTANVKNDSSTWWSNVQKWWDGRVGKVSPFSVDVNDDSERWWQDTKMRWIKSRGILDINATIPDEGASWWNTVQSYWNKHAGRLKTKLEIEVPKITVTWDKSIAPDTHGEVYKPNYTVKYNELGAIFGKASLLGFADGAAQVAGEAGREALLPLDRHTWWMDDIADRVVAKIGGGSSGTDRPIQVNLMVDGKVLTSTVVRNVNAQARATGVNPLAAYM